jgi:hypothetical protein
LERFRVARQLVAQKTMALIAMIKDCLASGNITRNCR